MQLPRPWRACLLLTLVLLPLAARAQSSVTLEHPYQLAAGLLPVELAARYELYRVNSAPEGTALRWVFTPRGDSAEIRTAAEPLPGASAYHASVRLGGETPLEVALGAEGFDGAWQWGESQRWPTRTWQTISLAAGSAPVRRLAVRLTGLQAGVRYVLDWQSVDWEAAPPGAEPPPAPPPAPSPPAPVTLDAEDTGPLVQVGSQARPPVFLDLADLPLSALPAEGGPRLYRLPATCAFDPYGRSGDAWRGPEQWDWSDLEGRLAALLARDPQAWVLLQVALDSPPWWEAQHPEALVPAPVEPPDLTAERKLSHASWFSPVWREAAAGALAQLARHVDQAPWADRVVGYELDAGRNGGWAPWYQDAAYQETGPAAQAAFRTWLQRRYGDLVELRSAWGQPRYPVAESPEVRQGIFFTEWTQITVPAAATLLDPSQPNLYDPSGQQDRADYQLFLGQHTADAILELLAAGRAATATPRLWGACYGHLLWWPAGDWPPSLSGQLGVGRLLQSGGPDFLVGPAGAEVGPSGPLGSLGLYGKLWLEQVAAQPAGAAAALVGAGAGAVCATPEQYAAATVTPRPEKAPQVALVLDEPSLAHLSPVGDLQAATLREQARELQAAGLAWEPWLLPEMGAADEGYPLYLMAATYAVSPEMLAQLRPRLEAPGTTTLWVYAAGALRGFIDASAVYQLTGLPVTLLTTPGSLRATLAAGDPVFSAGATQELSFGPRDPVQPRFALLASGEVAGRLNGTSWPALARRHLAGATIVYSAVPGVPGAVVRSLLEAAAGGH